MSLFKIVAIATFVAAAPVVALAADPLAVTISTEEVVPVTDASFDWNGFYAGVYGVAQTARSAARSTASGWMSASTRDSSSCWWAAKSPITALSAAPEPRAYLQGLGRAWALRSPTMYLYGAGGEGIDLGPPAETDVLLGGGVELAVTDRCRSARNICTDSHSRGKSEGSGHGRRQLPLLVADQFWKSIAAPFGRSKISCVFSND